MSTHKTIDRICVIAIAAALLLTILCMNGEALGIQISGKRMEYENRLFDTSKVHTIDIVMDDWDSFIASAQSEEYSVCSVIIDGEIYSNVGIRGKGNTSLSTVSSMNSDRYSFKIEFDQYDNTKSYYGLDKLSLNNLIQDTTYMKDYLTYQLMGQFGVAAPLCSYAYVTVNGEDWGLYLAVEAVENGFLQRNYGTDHGELYKPDSMSFGGGRGNGMDFDMEDFMNFFDNTELEDSAFPGMPDSFDPSSILGSQMPSGEMPSGEIPEDFDSSAMFGGEMNGMNMGSSDVKLQYIDDDPDSYSSIFNSAKTDITTADQSRLIQSLKTLSSGEKIESVVDIEQVIRYFVVHNFVVNGDSYTGSMIHNYYLYEENGQLSMIPWDYNLAFGTFQGGDGTSLVNDPIDSPLSVTGNGDRPIIDWIFSNADYTELYHHYFAEFLDHFDFAELIDETAELIAPYVEKDPTAFYSYEEFEAGAATLREFCLLRAESVRGQLSGMIPSTDVGQSADSTALLDASQLNLSDMGSMGGGMGGSQFGGGNRGDRFQTGQDAETGAFTPPGGMMTGDSFQAAGTQPASPGNAGSISGNQPSNETETIGRAPSQQFPEGQATPGNMAERPSDGTGSSFPSGDFSGTVPGAMNQSQSGTNLILLIASIAVLLSGLIAAFLFKRQLRCPSSSS